MTIQIVATAVVGVSVAAINGWLAIKIKFAESEAEATALYKQTFFRVGNAMLAAMCLGLIAWQASLIAPLTRLSVFLLMVPILVFSHQCWLWQFLWLRNKFYVMQGKHLDLTGKIIGTLQNLSERTN